MGLEEMLDKEWVYLLVQAKQMGIPKDEIRRFLRQGTLEKVPLLKDEKNVSFRESI